MIYFVACREANAVKIGATGDTGSDLHKRFSMIQGSCPLRLELLGVQDGYKIEERRLHAHFSSALIHGEWFRFTDEIRAHCATLLPVPERPAPKRHANRPYRKWADAA